jgi:hypothetical protein
MAKFSKSSNTFNFPDSNISEKDKNQAYHKQFTEAILYRASESGFDIYYQTLNESYEFFNGTNTGKEFDFLQSAEDGDVLPAEWINFNKIRTKVKLLMGELVTKGFSINVKTVNKDAEIRKKLYQEEMYMDMKLNPIAQDVEQRYAMPMGYNPNLPQNEEEFAEHFENYKEDAEFIMEEILKALQKKSRWAYERIALFRDLIITGRCFVKSEVINGMPDVRRIDPRYMIFDLNATDDYLSDATYFGEIRYMNFADAAMKYGMNKKEVQEAYNSYSSVGKFNPEITATTNQLIDGAKLKFYKPEKGELRVLVCTAYWSDIRRNRNKVSEDKYGKEHIKTLDDSATVRKRDENLIEHSEYKVWRKATLIGHDIVKDWGIAKNLVKSVDNLYEADCPFQGYVQDFVNKQGISLVQQLKGLQKLKDIMLYNLQLDVARAGAKGFVYDVSQIPEGWDITNVLKYAKVTGIVFVDTKKDGIPSTFNQFPPIDQTLSDSIRKYIEASYFIDEEMDKISGINDARQGQVQSASQAVGVTQSALMQSNLITQPMFDGFLQFSTRVWEHQAGLAKYTWRDKEKWATLLGISNIDLIEGDLNLDLNDYSVALEATPIILDDPQMFSQLVMASLQSQSIEPEDAMDLMMEKDIEVAIRKFKKIKAQREQAQKQHEMMLAQQQQQAAAAQQQQQSAAMDQMQGKKLQGDMALQGQKDEGAMDRELAKGRVGLKGKLIDAKFKAKENQQKAERTSKDRK